jgi:uncharacterized protein (TIGR03435 family)
MDQLLNHLWQSTLFAAAAGLLTLALRRNHARTRYWLWLAASVKFLMPFSLLVGVGSHIEWRTAPEVVQPVVYVMAEEVSQPFTAAPTPAARIPTTEILAAAWALGFLVVVLYWGRKWLRMRAAVRAASPMPLAFPVPVRSSSALIEPGVFGIFRPVLVLPAGIADRLTPAQLDAILAHELCHVRRRDNLAAAIHMFVEAIFWFHPLVWWLGARLLEERERACDEEVLRLGSEPQVYAEGILTVCEFYLESPLTCVAGVTGADLRNRMERIMCGHDLEALSGWKKIILAAAGVIALAVPVLFGALTAPSRLLAQSPGARPEFEVASVKLSLDETTPGVDFEWPPGGRLRARRNSAYDFIQHAYDVRYYQILGAPDWMNSTRFDVDAKADGNPGREEMNAMLRTLLEDRFKLKVHRETRQFPVFNLTVAKGGSRLQTSKEACVAFDPDHPPDHDRPHPVTCGNNHVFMKGQNMAWEATDIDMASLTWALAAATRQTVIDRTGLIGTFDVHLEWTPSETALGPTGDADASGPSLFTVLQEQLGLKLESGKGPVEVLVIDHVEKPSPN